MTVSVHSCKKIMRQFL